MKTKTQNQNQTNTSELQSRSEQLSSDKTKNREPLPQIDLELRQNNRQMPTEKLLATLKETAPRLWELAEVVGKWVWVRFEDKQPREVTTVLSQLGFHWNNKRQVWQHPCGQPSRAPASVDPRERYGSHFVADTQPA